MYNNKLENSVQMQIRNDENIDYDWSNSTILVIEDDMVNYKVTESILRTTGINILHAENGYKAIDYVHYNPQINLVLINGNHPNISSFETTREILDVNPLLPIIAQTATYSDPYIMAGCKDFINKPINEDNLVGKMSKFMSGKSENELIPV